MSAHEPRSRSAARTCPPTHGSLFPALTSAPSVLFQDHRERWFNVDDFDPGIVIGEEFNPTLPGLPDHVRGIEGERRACPQQVPAPFPRKLSDLALVVGRINVEFIPNVVKRNDWQIASV